MARVVSLRSRTVPTLDLATALDELDNEQRIVIDARWGLSGEEPLTDEEVAERFGWEVNWVWHLYDHALQTFGYLWLTEVLPPLGLEEAA